MIRVLIAEPTALIREGLIAILGREHDIDLVAVLKLGQEVIPRRAHKPAGGGPSGGIFPRP